MLDLVVTGGTAVMPATTEAADIGVAGGKIAAIGAPGSLAADRRRPQRSMLPGRSSFPAASTRTSIAACRSSAPGQQRADLLSAPPEQVSRAALHGGTTTLLDFALCPPDVPLQESIEARQREWAGACYCDFGFHLMLRGSKPRHLLDALPEAVQAGHATVKIFTTDIRPLNAGPHGQVRRHLGSPEDHGEGRRSRRRSTPRTTTSSCTCTRS